MDKAQWAKDKSRQIIYRVVAEGTLVLETPAHFGTGEQNGTELIILQDALDGSPLLTGASQAGALRHYLLQREKGYRVADNREKHNKTSTTKLFGEALDDDRGEQSRIIIHDALGKASKSEEELKAVQLGIRDGVKIDGKYRTAEDGALFNVQVWPEGTSFDLRLELYICEDDDCDDLTEAFAAALKALQDGEIPLGARKNRGYGRCKVADWQVYEYDLSQPNNFLAWVKNDTDNIKNSVNTFLQQAEGFDDKRERVKLEATFKLCDSLMIRTDTGLADNTHLRNAAGQPILSGTSVAGALRARALKIAKTIKSDEKAEEAEKLVNDMFGRHGSSDDENSEEKQPMTASRIRVEEHTIKKAEVNYVQNRVKIDRFTGGAYETALISEQPVFAREETQVTINLELQYPADADKRELAHKATGLLLLLLKDLWTEDLPLGGESSIGRGRLKGVSAELQIGKVNSPAIYGFNEDGLEDSTKSQIDELQYCVNKLWGQACPEN
jgi:CRISPR/Cas system CSM-associated protein Csm3 (group 7 of RAMP superfamily)